MFCSILNPVVYPILYWYRGCRERRVHHPPLAPPRARPEERNLEAITAPVIKYAHMLLAVSPILGLVVRAPAPMMQASVATAAPPLVAERYIATNRFRVKEGREAAFEKRWADRKSKLGLLDGFRFFCMMRRVERGEGKAYEDDINYISCTVWEEQKFFEAWKSGDAFKEAHGGGTIGGIASMLVATAMNTKGKPKAAMWEGVLPVSMGAGDAQTEAWRQVDADGINMLNGECFLAMNRFTVAEGSETAFEQRFAQRESKLEEYDGFKGFILLRRDGKDEDGFNYSTCVSRIEPCTHHLRLSQSAACSAAQGCSPLTAIGLRVSCLQVERVARPGGFRGVVRCAKEASRPESQASRPAEWSCWRRPAVHLRSAARSYLL